MKNLFRFGFFALALSISLSACDFFGRSPKAATTDTLTLDSGLTDTLKQDTTAIDAHQTKPDSVVIAIPKK